MNGNYIVFSGYWNGNRGAATWGNGSSGTTGTINSGNSLVGTTGGVAGDFVGDGHGFTLLNGNYVVLSPNWSDGKGAATWGNGSTGTVGTINNTNSLVGTLLGDHVGSGGAFGRLKQQLRHS